MRMHSSNRISGLRRKGLLDDNDNPETFQSLGTLGDPPDKKPSVPESGGSLDKWMMQKHFEMMDKALEVCKSALEMKKKREYLEE